MKKCLEESGKIIVKSTGLEKFHQDDKLAVPPNTDCAWSVLAAAYHLLRSNPSRFQKDDLAIGFTWGFSDEDWNRAVCVVRFVNQRRSTPMKPYVRSNFRKPIDTYTWGYADEKSIQEAKEAGKDARNDASALVMQDETDYIDRLFEEAGDPTDDQVPTEEELRTLALQLPEILRIEDETERSETVNNYLARCRDNPELVSEITTSCLVDNLARHNSNVDLSDALNRKLSSKRMTITRNEKTELRRFLAQIITVVHDGPSKDWIASCGSRSLTANEDRLDLSMRLEQERYEDSLSLQGADDLSEDAQGLDSRLQEAEESSSEKSDADPEKLRQGRAHLGERLPDNEDLKALCELYSINQSTLQVNPHVEQTRNLPTQIPGKLVYASLVAGSS